MHIENELAEIVTTGDHEAEEIIEEYEEEILVQEEVPEPPLTDSHHAWPRQAPVHNLYFSYPSCIYVCVLCIYVVGIFFETTSIYIYIYCMSSTSTGSSSCYA